MNKGTVIEEAGRARKEVVLVHSM